MSYEKGQLLFLEEDIAWEWIPDFLTWYPRSFPDGTSILYMGPASQLLSEDALSGMDRDVIPRCWCGLVLGRVQLLCRPAEEMTVPV